MTEAWWLVRHLLLVPCSVVPVSELWERVLLYGEAGSALLHSVGSLLVFCMSSYTGVIG